VPVSRETAFGVELEPKAPATRSETKRGWAIVYADSVLIAALSCVTGVLFVLMLYGVVGLLAPKRPDPLKNASYECGHEPVGVPRAPFRVQYYAIAIVFLIFDVETAFLYPWGLVLRQLGWAGFGEMAIFVAVLVVGLVYAWRKGVLKWA
jgi:NADH-quinone oxidoreductase subunit A